MNFSRDDQKLTRERAKEWRSFRKTFLFKQVELAALIGCSRETVIAVERGKVIQPRFELLRRFRDLRRRHEEGRAREQESAKPMRWQ